MRLVFKLETDRLRFRELAVTDLGFVAEMLGDSEVMQFYPKCLDRDEARQWIDRQRQRYSDDGYGLWLVERRDSGVSVGQVGLVQQWVQRTREAEIGYLMHRSFWRQGFAAEAAAGVRDHALGVLGLPRVVSLIRPMNLPSQGVASKIGMSRCGTAFHSDVEHLVYAINRDEWDRPESNSMEVG